MNGVGNIPAWDPVLILQGESNYAPWLQSLIRYLGREYWHVLLGADRTPSQSDNGEYFVDTAQAGPSQDIRSCTITQEPDAFESTNGYLDQRGDGDEDTPSRALSYFRSTLNDEAQNLIRNIDSPSEAFKKISLFYGKPRHQTMALRWSEWVSLRYVPGTSATEFVDNFRMRVQDVEDIGDFLDHKVVFAQFVHAISAYGEYPNFLLQLSPDLQDPDLMETVCVEFIRHSTSFPYAVPRAVNPQFAYGENTTTGQTDGYQYCPYHNRMVKHVPAQCRLGQRMNTRSRYQSAYMFGGYNQQYRYSQQHQHNQQYQYNQPYQYNHQYQQYQYNQQYHHNKRRRVDSCGTSGWMVPTGYYFQGS
jgi:hypothetical protein